MAVNTHFTPLIATRQTSRRPSAMGVGVAVVATLILAMISARLGGPAGAAIVVGVGGGAFGVGLTSARQAVLPPRVLPTRMLSELRERVRVQGSMPKLPVGWRVESAVRAAGGDSFAGDFVAANRSGDSRFEVALVDVSGNGLEAGSRSMLMGGAVSGLLGPIAPADFLPAANDYLVRQGWSEGFATAIHACVDLADGRFSVGSAGHPSPVQFQAATATWLSIEGASGTCLGVLDAQDAQDYPRAVGVLERGDALLLYSDGIAESRESDLHDGLLRVLAGVGIAPTAVGFADRLCEAGGRGSGSGTDRTVIVICRD